MLEENFRKLVPLKKKKLFQLLSLNKQVFKWSSELRVFLKKQEKKKKAISLLRCEPDLFHIHTRRGSLNISHFSCFAKKKKKKRECLNF